ncbi:hypothetical protein F4780DRAFT_796877 [Xylariomycetidae sp. FL0641]|nr:hypothetical protein F4780DRAFT_796877 [Xylariomycetidae sp. FL0641]
MWHKMSDEKKAPYQANDDERGEWLAHALLLTTAHKSGDTLEPDTYWRQPPCSAFALDLGPNSPPKSQRRVLQLKAQYEEHNRFKILEPGKFLPPGAVVAALTLGGDLPFPHSQAGGSFYLAVHNMCMSLVERFTDHRSMASAASQMAPQDGISSISQLWEVLYHRFPGWDDSAYILPEPHDYYGGRGCRNVYWGADEDPEYGKLIEANPVEIPELTQCLLRNLRPETAKVPKCTSAEADCNQAPHATHKQEWWYDALITKRLCPWLWDLDINAVQQKRQTGSWDWEDIVCRLTQGSIHEPSDEALTLPTGLRNRRRIWRLLGDARVGDAEEYVRPSGPFTENHIES